MLLPTTQRPSQWGALCSKRRGVLIALAFALVTTLGWMYELDAYVHESRESNVQLMVSTSAKELTGTPEVRSQPTPTPTLTPPPPPSRTKTMTPPPTPTKKCVKLDHRDGMYAKQNPQLCLTRQEVKWIVKDIVRTAADLFIAHDITYFLGSGTLLGSYREKGLIPHDGDADFGIDAAGLKYLQHNPVKLPPAYALTVWNSSLSLYPTARNDDKLPIRLVHKETALYADVFVFLEWGNSPKGERMIGPLPSVCFGHCVHCTTISRFVKHFKVPYNWVYPLVDCPFEDRTFKSPRETAKYLSMVYGAGFMTPH